MNNAVKSILISVLICLPMTTFAAEKAAISCKTIKNAADVYAGQLQSIEVPVQVEPNQLFAARVKIQNTGNTTWFSEAVDCPGQSTTYLGTTRNQDRESIFHAPAVFGDTKWLKANRIQMKTPRVDPGQIAEFTIIGHAPAKEGIYREYFAPVVEQKTWINDKAEFKFDIIVGNPEKNENILKYTRNILMSMNLTDPEFIGKKKIIVDISEQKMYLKLGEMTLKSFPISTGTTRTPTPIGTTSIQFKQEVRVAASSPHYIMPKFMQFRRGGYGIHALPSLANDRGVFWREALNHIGTRRSHGCIRLLPDDANFTYDFAEVGTPVQVVW